MHACLKTRILFIIRMYYNIVNSGSYFMSIMNKSINFYILMSKNCLQLLFSGMIGNSKMYGYTSFLFLNLHNIPIIFTYLIAFIYFSYSLLILRKNKLF